MDHDIYTRPNFKKTRVDISSIPRNHTGFDKKYYAYYRHRRKTELVQPGVTEHVHHIAVVWHHGHPRMHRLCLHL